MSFELATRIKVVNPSSDIDELYGPYNSLSEAYSKIPKSLRKGGRTFGIIENDKVIEYWWVNDNLVDDGDEEYKMGSFPTLGPNGNWWIGGVDTGHPYKGEKGDKGDSPFILDGVWWVGNLNTLVPASGLEGKSAYEIWEELPGNSGKDEFEFIDSLKGEKGEDGKDGSDVIIDPDTKTWVVDGVDTEVTAEGVDGITPHIEGGNWWIGDVDTGFTAVAVDGQTPYIFEGEWWVGNYNTEITAQGKSAYEVWKEIPGNESGTLQDYLDSLKGEKGEGFLGIFDDLSSVNFTPKKNDVVGIETLYGIFLHIYDGQEWVESYNLTSYIDDNNKWGQKEF